MQATKSPGVELAVTVGTNDSPETWGYRLAFRTNQQGYIPGVMEEEVRHNGKLILNRPNEDDEKDSARLIQTHLEQISMNQEFRELSEFLKSIRYLHIVPHLVRDPDRSAGKHDDPFGGDFLERMASVSSSKREKRLNNINSALRCVIPQFESLELNRENGNRWHLEARFSHWRKSPARQDERTFSDGTLRLIGLLWSLAEEGGPLLLEEPEIGLHNDLVRRLPIIMARMHTKSGRQVIITTHSDALLADEGIGLDEVHVLLQGDQGTKIKTGAGFEDVRAMVQEGGMSIGDALLPKVAPDQTAQFALSHSEWI